MYQQSWNSVINAQWPALYAGKKVWVDVHPAFHPKHGTLFRENVGWPAGQTSDYTISYKDGSRLHAQCFGIRNGFVRVRLHRDKFDPDQGFLNFVLHGLLETPVGPAMVGVLVVGTIGVAASA